MTLIEQLQRLEQELKRLIVLDDASLQPVIDETGDHLPGCAAEASPRGYLAGTLFSVEQGCGMLRERLHVPLRSASQITLREITLTDQAGNVIGQSERLPSEQPDDKPPA
jgi:hypothetical protein